jgi:hypothetical protein
MPGNNSGPSLTRPVERRYRPPGQRRQGLSITQQGSKLVASPSNRQGVMAPGACQTRTSLHWATVLQVYFSPCRAHARAFLGRSRGNYALRASLMLKPGLTGILDGGLRGGRGGGAGVFRVAALLAYAKLAL